MDKELTKLDNKVTKQLIYTRLMADKVFLKSV